MILYHALTTYHFLSCIVHRLLYHPQDKSVLLIDANDLPRLGYSDYGRIIESGLFDRVIRFPSAQIIDPASVTRLNLFFENLLLPNKIQDFEKFYIAGIHSDFALYLSTHRIRFWAFEDGAGLLSRQYEFITGLSTNFPDRYRLLKQYGLADFSSAEIERIFIDENAQLPNFHDPRSEPFDVVSGFNSLKTLQQDAILNWFGVSNIDPTRIEQKNSLLLTQSLSSNRFMSFESECRMLRRIVSTYAIESELLIKPHPDNLLPLETMFPSAYVLPASFPLELFPIVSPRKFSRLIEIDSAGARVINFFFDQTVKLYWDYLRSYRLEDEYRAVLTYLKTVPHTNPILTIGIDLYHFDALTARIYPDLSKRLMNRIKITACGRTESAQLSARKQPSSVIIDAENARNFDRARVNSILYASLNQGGRVVVINNLRGNSIEERFPILKSAHREARLIDAESEIGTSKRLILIYDSSLNRVKQAEQ